MYSMKWLIQEFLNHSNNTERMISALEGLGLDYGVVRLNKDKSLTLLDKSDRLPVEDSDKKLVSFIEGHPVMVYGSKTFAEVSKEMGLVPGSFWNDSFEFEVFREAVGEELLNPHFIIGELQELEPEWDRFFIRPTGNTKLFTGMTVTIEEFKEWKERESGEMSTYKGQTLMIAPLQEIRAEFRLFVVNDKVITASSYVVNGKQDTSAVIDESLLRYADTIISRFPLAEAYVLDIADTSNGYKVIEYNNINTSGLYDCDETRIINAIQHIK